MAALAVMTCAGFSGYALLLTVAPALGGRGRSGHRRLRAGQRRAAALHRADPAARPSRAGTVRLGSGPRRRPGPDGRPRHPVRPQRRARRDPRPLRPEGRRLRGADRDRQRRGRRAGRSAAPRGGDRGLRPRGRDAQPRPAPRGSVDRGDLRLLVGVRPQRPAARRHPGALRLASTIRPTSRTAHEASRPIDADVAVLRLLLRPILLLLAVTLAGGAVITFTPQAVDSPSVAAGGLFLMGLAAARQPVAGRGARGPARRPALRRTHGRPHRGRDGRGGVGGRELRATPASSSPRCWCSASATAGCRT